MRMKMRTISESALLDKWPMQFIPIGMEAKYLYVGVVCLESSGLVLMVRVYILNKFNRIYSLQSCAACLFSILFPFSPFSLLTSTAQD